MADPSICAVQNQFGRCGLPADGHRRHRARTEFGEIKDIVQVARRVGMYETPEPLRWEVGEYAVRLMRGERVVRSAVLNAWDRWHVPLSGGRYRSYATQAEAIYALVGAW